MKFKSVIAYAAASIAIGLTACARNVPVYNVSAEPVTSTKPAPALDEVGKAIQRAGVTLGWQMREARPGLIVGSLILRRHMATVAVTYDTRAYSITYKDSAELDYDGQNIHKNYNGWIQNLDRNIKAQLSAL